MPVGEICRKAMISQATYFNLRKKYIGLMPDEMRRLRALEDENSRLKKIVADLTLDREILQDAGRYPSKNLRPVRKHEGIDKLCTDWGASFRRACTTLPFDRSSYHYRSRRSGQAAVEQRIKAICQTRIRYG